MMNNYLNLNKTEYLIKLMKNLIGYLDSACFDGCESQMGYVESDVPRRMCQIGPLIMIELMTSMILMQGIKLKSNFLLMHKWYMIELMNKQV